MTEPDDRLDALLRATVLPHDQGAAAAAATRAAALAELRTHRRRRSWAGRLESTALVAAAAAQLVWVMGTLLR